MNASTIAPTAQRRLGGFAILGLLIPLAISILACGGGGATTTSGGGAASGAGSAKAKAPAKVGDTITVDGVSTTLVSVKTIQPGDIDQAPQAGDSYFVLHIKITNKGSNTANYNEIEYKILTGAGSTDDTPVILSTEPSNALLGAGQLAAGGTKEGDLVFEIGTTDHGAKLVWQPSFDQSLDNVWSLGL
ncbi:MAG TPA: DUF4352 domain-containing protein [Ktedonobacterales bacterium]